MKSKIGIKIITIAIGISALLAGIFVTKYYQSSTDKNQSFIQETTMPSVSENSNQSSTNIETSPTKTTDRQQKFPFWRILWLSLKWTFIIVGIFVGFILLLKILVQAIGWIGKDSHSRSSINLGLIVLFGLLLAIYFLPRSQILLFNSWETSTDVKETSFFFDKIFGVAPNRYDVDIQGHVTALYLKDNNLHNLEQLTRIENLSSLQHLEISDSPLEGIIDVSAFTELKELHLRNTNLKQILGLNELTKLNRLNLEGSPIEKIESVGTVQKLNLSRTKITDLSALSYLPPLKELNLEEMNLSQIQGLESLPPIDLISLRKCTQVSLERLGSVKILILDGSDVTDLSPLRNLLELTTLSIFETKVEHLDGLENSKIVFINTDNPNFTSEKLKQIFNRDVIVSRVNFNTFSLIPSHIWQSGKSVALALLIGSFLLLLPLPFAYRTPRLLKLKRIALFMIPGALLVLGLLMIAVIDIPLSYGQEGRADFSRFVFLYAMIVGLLWLIAMPLLILGLETKTLSQNAISPALFFLSRILPWLTFISPFFTFWGYLFWIDENVNEIGSLLIICLAITYFFLPLFFGVSLLIQFLATRNIRLRGPNNKLPIIFFLSAMSVTILSLIFAISILVYFFVYSASTGNLTGKTIVLVASGWILLIALFVVLQMIQAVLAWRGKEKDIADVLNGESETEAVIEVPFRQSSFEIPLLSIFNFMAKEFFSSAIEKHLGVINAQNVGQATSVPVRNQAQMTLSGVVVIIQRQELLRSKEWEFQSLREWVSEIYRKTWSPIWIVGDWIGEFMPENKSVNRKLEILDSLNPFVSGLENVSAPTGSIFGMNPPDNIADCLRANQIIERDKLDALGLPKILQNAPTPIARMLRSIFGQSHLANRLDLTVRCAETAIAMISLISIAEYKFGKQQNDSVEKAIAQFLPKPMFGSWKSLFDTFAKNSDSVFVQQIAQNLKNPALPESQELRVMIETIGGAKAVNNVALEIKTIRETLSLLIAARNVITAHGPAVERAAPELYRAVLLVALDFLASLQWRSFVFYTVLPDGKEIYFKNCLPEIVKNGSRSTEANKVFVKLSDEGENRQIDVSKFFQVEETTLSLAVYAEENRFVEPVSGLYVNFGQTDEG